MRLYLDDDSASRLLVRLLEAAGHDVETPESSGMRGKDDSVQLTHAVREDRALLSRNHDDFQNLHDLVDATGGVHRGIFIVRRENNRRRDMNDHSAARAIANFLAADMPIENQFVVLNHWR